ncbi:hypothetical protein Tco_0290916 [Tanacetum coccineum]
MPPRVMTQSVGRPAAESLGGGTGVRVGRGGRGRRPREDPWDGGSNRAKTYRELWQISRGALTDEAVRNGSIKKVEKRGNVGENNKDKNGKDDNKRTRTGNIFATTVNPVQRIENKAKTHEGLSPPPCQQLTWLPRRHVGPIQLTWSEVLFIRGSECGRVHSRRVSTRNDLEAHVASCDWRIQLAYEVVNRTMSSPNRSTSDIEDAFSSINILNYTSVSSVYTSVSSDYFPALSGCSSFNSSENTTDNMIPPVFSSFYNNPYLKDVQAFYFITRSITSQILLTPSLDYTSLLFDPRYFFISEELLPPKKRICSSSSSSINILNYTSVSLVIPNQEDH